jgi:uncharacterized protein YndB with AHSA1/START domain
MDAPGSLVVKKQIAASCEEVFDAWTDPMSLMEFMRPGTVQRVDAEVDARVGGKFRIDMIGASSTTSHTGEYLVIDRPRLLKFTWISKYTDNRPSVVTIELTPRGAMQCEIVLTHRELPENQVKQHTEGWTWIADSLASLVGPAKKSAKP